MIHEDQTEFYTCPICGAGIGNDIDGAIEHDCPLEEQYVKDMTHTDSVEAIVASKFTTNKNEGIGPAIDREPPRMILTKRAYNTVIELLTTLQATQSQQVEEAVKDIIKMADALELECGKDGDKGTKQWMAFKGFRNTIRDKYLTPNHQD